MHYQFLQIFAKKNRSNTDEEGFVLSQPDKGSLQSALYTNQIKFGHYVFGKMAI